MPDEAETRVLPYEFSRGSADKRENSWECIGRLAEEVGWRRFVVGGALWYVSEEWLAKQRVAYRFSEFTRGVLSGPDFGFDTRQSPAEATLRVLTQRYAVRPGDSIELFDLGPADGRWLVTGTRRKLHSSQTEVTIKRPLPKLAEPAPQVQVTVQASQPSSVAIAPGGGPVSAPAGSLAAVRVSGAWGGMQSIFTQFVHPFMARYGLRAGSQKRSATGAIGSSSGSDHHVSQANAFATDYPTGNGAGAAAAVAHALGVPHRPNTYTSGNTTIGGVRVRVQVLWGAAIAHGDHVHVGIRRA